MLCHAIKMLIDFALGNNIYWFGLMSLTPKDYPALEFFPYFVIIVIFATVLLSLQIMAVVLMSWDSFIQKEERIYR
jgi:hypothetical protein